jgi:glycosyltransferase involved in cell wall biosynthesis
VVQRSLKTMKTSPAVSIITPTANRHSFLPLIARCVLRQSIDWQWLVHDDSPQPCDFMVELSKQDSRVRYFHKSGERLTIGAKRNLLIHEADAPIIAHFDDDDFYSPSYLFDMIQLMNRQSADLVKLSEFYMYAPHTNFFGYMDLNAKTGPHYVLTGTSVEHIEFHEKMQIGADFLLFYGFSYVYRKNLFDRFAFDDISLYEDERFIKSIVSTGGKVIAVDDKAASCLHLIHPTSTSRCFSRYSMPDFVLRRLFPGYEGYPL